MKLKILIPYRCGSGMDCVCILSIDNVSLTISQAKMPQLVCESLVQILLV